MIVVNYIGIVQLHCIYMNLLYQYLKLIFDKFYLSYFPFLLSCFQNIGKTLCSIIIQLPIYWWNCNLTPCYIIPNL